MDFTINIDIICPACSRKALLTIDSKVPDGMFSAKRFAGKASCIHCGFKHPKLTVVNEDLYYKFPVADRMFYARNKENLIWLRDFFKNRSQGDNEPYLDFPKTFYMHRDEIVKKIDSFL